MNLPILSTAVLVDVFDHVIGGIEQPCVNARDLHRWLESGQHFADWIKRRIAEYGFTEGVDFTIHKNMYRENQELSGWKTAAQYVLTLNMAKELAMVEKTEKGRQARRYFIDCERAAHQFFYSLTAQFVRADLECQNAAEQASYHGRGLQHCGKVTKPQALARRDALLAKMQPMLPFGGAS